MHAEQSIKVSITLSRYLHAIISSGLPIDKRCPLDVAESPLMDDAMQPKEGYRVTISWPAFALRSVCKCQLVVLAMCICLLSYITVTMQEYVVLPDCYSGDLLTDTFSLMFIFGFLRYYNLFLKHYCFVVYIWIF